MDAGSKSQARSTANKEPQATGSRDARKWRVEECTNQGRAMQLEDRRRLRSWARRSPSLPQRQDGGFFQRLGCRDGWGDPPPSQDGGGSGWGAPPLDGGGGSGCPSSSSSFLVPDGKDRGLNPRLIVEELKIRVDAERGQHGKFEGNDICEVVKKMIMVEEQGRELRSKSAQIGSVFDTKILCQAAKCQPESCGSMNVSYPFWIDNSDCGYPGFQIKCKVVNSTGQPALFLTAFEDYNATHVIPSDFPIMEINYTGNLIINSTSLKAYSCNFSTDTRKYFELLQRGHSPFPRPIAYCDYGCCETVLADNWKLINFTGKGWFYYNKVEKCGFSTVFDPTTFKVVDENTDMFFGVGRKASYGLRVNWGIGLQNCSIAKTVNYSCAFNAECIDSPTGKGHVCKCLPGYEGSGYSNGTSCTDVDECNRPDLNLCAKPSKGGICQNSEGSYNCSCAKGYKGDGFQCESSTSSKNYLIPATIGSVSSFNLVSLGACGIFWCLRRRRLNNIRDKYFLQNGGLQLQEHIASLGGRKNMTIFSEKELEIASNHYSTELGRGGFATVYKGVLVDGTQVALKKPKAISGEFINEIMIFSHVNHRNIVKLLGSCLQTQFPLLVYEFVPNGTLFEHLHSPHKSLAWETRRQIAIETADAITYMHLQASQRIFHRDIKSSNILLDDTFTPKVVDFGVSRLRPCDETHLSTMAVGTRGYLDPEFVENNQFTDKSDVFSYGVVLVELLTGLNPLLSIEGIVCTLYDHFLSAINCNHLSEILDVKVVNEENQAQMENMARLAKACLQMKSKARPSMREVVEELAWIRAATKQSGGLRRDVTLVEHKGNSTQAKMNDYMLLMSVEGTSEDLYTLPAPTEIITSEDPSTTLIQIQMSDMYAR
ncbi:hypothetical protein KI387_020375 [Taxus chinensis]|uniref:Uncharacterized protein n=1 Tax=Taxus chinensis TaxID=29808 RepID=A0AA38LC81_TAXCH|nr:hypothetical protein KI387_020375 [Taxus chinensis]